MKKKESKTNREFQNNTNNTILDMDFKDKIIINNLIKIYKRKNIEVVALNGLDLTVNPGEIIVIMGPSGCGKTTLLNLIGGLDIPEAGSIYIDGKNIVELNGQDLDIFRREKIGFVFQFLNLIPTLNAEENILLGLTHNKSLTSNEKKERVNTLLKLVSMENRRNHSPDSLSGGEQQRIAIAAALANDPKIILADEPTGELDSVTQENVLEIFKKSIEIDPNKIIIIVTHDPRVQAIADRVLIIRDGKIIYEHKGGKSSMTSDISYDSKDSMKVVELANENKKLNEEIHKFYEVKEMLKKAYEKIK